VRRIVTGRPIVDFVDAINGGTRDDGASGIGLEDETGQIIAGVKYDNWNGRSVCMHVAALPGVNWLTRGFARACFDYAFNQLGVSKVLGLVDAKNVAARRFDEHLGFKIEATIADASPGGDLLIYSMTRASCRYI
jgi:RimJ/RimL family protein N-acetyltransferase